MKDMIFHSYLRSEDIEHEKKIIIQESWQRYKNKKYLTHLKETMNNLFSGHEHARFNRALGYPTSISTISQDDVVSFYKKYYGIGNFFIILTGAVEEKHISLLEGFLKDLPQAITPTRDIGAINKLAIKRVIKKAEEIGEMKEQAEISIAYIAEKIPLEKSQSSYLFTRLLYDLLNERLRIEHSLCYGVYVRLDQNNSYSQLSVNVRTDESNIELIETKFKNVLAEIRGEKHRDRFNIVKQTFLEEVRSSEYLSSEIADDALEEISKYDGHIITIKEQLNLIEKIDYADMVEYLLQAFDPEYTYTEIILSSGNH